MSYNKIMVHNVKYNGLTFLNSPFFRPAGGFLCLKEFSFFEVATQASTEKYAIRHGEYVSPTEKKNRRIRFLFDILADTEEERRALLKQVQRAFSPEQNPSPFNPKLWKPLTFEDVEGEVWTCNCQVLKGIELSDFGNEKRVGISVELITDSSDFKNTNTNTLTGGRNTRMGIVLNTTLDKNWQYYREGIEYDGVNDSPVIITCTITDATNPFPHGNLQVIHDYTGGYGTLQIENLNSLDWVVGDKIIIDTDKRRVYVIQDEIEEDITGLVVLGSERPLIKYGTNNIAIDTAETFKVMDVDIERYDLF